MRPLALTLAGAALGLAATLPLARAQLDAATVAPTVQTAPAVPGQLPSDGRSPARQPILADSAVTGPVVATRYGPVQVQVVMSGTRLTKATAVQLPSTDGRSREINATAGPRLDAAALAAGSAQIDTVSGATWTSDGYRRSLQAALDEARALATSPSVPAGSS